jgi:5'-nucleotidase
MVAGVAAAATKANSTLTILVTNDDGVSAPGIDAAVQVLAALPHTKVIVVAPQTNQSGTGPKVTGGTLTAMSATTASGYPAKAVAGYPADTIIWAMDDHGISQRPDLVVSGINLGENIGPFVDASGTVGAAETALARGVPALAVSQGVDNGASADFSQGAKYLVGWVQAHRKVLVAGKKGVAKAANGNLNVPTCATGQIRGPVNVTVAPSFTGYSVGTVNCSGTGTKPKTDVQAFVNGFAGISKLEPVNPPH